MIMALIPPFYLDCTVAIGVVKENQFVGIGSGFLYGHFLKKINEETGEYGVYLVTNKHVLKDKEIVYIRFNPKNVDQPAKDFPIVLIESNKPVWYSLKEIDVDVAIVRINIRLLEEKGIHFRYFYSDKNIANKEKLNEIGTTEGDFIYTIGFPMNLIGEKRNYAIVRHGTIARIRDYLSGELAEILIDSLIFPGNSGGPVVSKPELTRIDGTQSQSAAYLIGLVQSYIPYQDYAISPQTGRTRVMFEENSGLGSVVPIEFVIRSIEEFEIINKDERCRPTVPIR